MFKKNMHRKLYEYLVEEIGMRIIKGDYQPGDTLPVEDVLCKELGVSRGVLREATKVLAKKGLIRSRQKTGTQVQPRGEWNHFDSDVLIWKFKTSDRADFLRRVTEARRIIESEAAKLAAERAGPQEVEKIRALSEEMVTSFMQGSHCLEEDYILLDLKFHTAILEASHNEILSQIGSTLRQALITARQIDIQDMEILRTSFPFHQAMTDAIANHDPDAAYRASQAMFDQVYRYIPEFIHEKKDEPPGVD